MRRRYCCLREILWTQGGGHDLFCERLISLETVRRNSATLYLRTAKLQHFSVFDRICLTAPNHRKEAHLRSAIMAELDWKTLQLTAFKVQQYSTSAEKRPAPLQMRPFTSESYEAIKERERRKRCPKMNTHASRGPYAQTTEDVAKTVQPAPALETSRLHFAAGEVAPASHSEDLQSEESVIPDYGIKHGEDDFQHKSRLLGAPSVSTFEGRSGGGVSHPTSLASPAMSPDTRLELESEQFNTPHPNDRTSPLCDVQMISSHGDEGHGPLQQPRTGGNVDPELCITSSLTSRE